jgi:hypothetical protein
MSLKLRLGKKFTRDWRKILNPVNGSNLRKLHGSHASAFVRAGPALRGAFLAVIVFEHLAFPGTRVANSRAKRAVFLSETGICRHVRDGHFAHPCAFHQHFDAPCPCLYIGFVKARVHALIAGFCASVARVDTSLISGVFGCQH